MKAQGLPLNFIILGALALLVLVVAVAFFMSGTATLTSGMTQQQLSQKCTSLCSNIDQLTRLSTNTSSNCGTDINGCLSGRALTIATEYLNVTYQIPGFQGAVTCESVTPCQVRFADLSSCLLQVGTDPAKTKICK